MNNISAENLTLIDVEVHCVEPSWVISENSKYRLYFDDELMTERDWIWPLGTSIQENLVVEITKNVVHTLRVEVIKQEPTNLTKLVLKNLNVNGARRNPGDANIDNLSFMLE